MKSNQDSSNSYARIEQIFSYLHTNAYQFSKEICINSSLISEIKRGKTSNISPNLAAKIVSRYPEISINWLLTGEGDMLTTSTAQTAVGNHNTQVSGNDNHVTHHTPDPSPMALSMVSTAQAQLTKAQEQIDRLLSIIEKMQEMNKQ